MVEEKNLFSCFDEYANEKDISQEDIIAVFKNALFNALKIHFGDNYDENHFNIVVDIDAKNVQMLHYLNIVKHKNDNNINTISLSEAKKIEKNFEEEEVVVKKIEFNIFSRNEVYNIKKQIVFDIKILKQQSVYRKYSQLVGELVSAIVYRYCHGYIMLHDAANNELMLPYSEVIPGERLMKNRSVDTIVKKVEMNKDRLVIILSRIENVFLRKLLELEVPEISDGIILIKKIARIPGKRSKVVVESVDAHIDSIGACIGPRCSRLNAITNKLSGESIDFIQYSTDLSVFITRSLGVKKIEKIKNYKDGLFVYVNQEEVGMAIGQDGVNIRLLRMLLDKSVNIFQYKHVNCGDVVVDDFFESLDPWIIATMKDCGFETTKDISTITPEEFEKRTDLETETVQTIYTLLKKQVHE